MRLLRERLGAVMIPPRALAALASLVDCGFACWCPRCLGWAQAICAGKDAMRRFLPGASDRPRGFR